MTPADQDILDASAADTFAGAPSFSLRHRLHRAVFGIIWALFCAWTPPPLRRWRNLVLRLFGAKLHPSANIYGSARIWYPPNLIMDEQASLGPGAICYCMAPVHIGARAVISQGAHLCAGTHDIDDPRFQLFARPIGIGAGAWIAAEAFVGPGVIVGEKAVLGARGVTVKNLDAAGVYAGNPARKIRERK
jgi:putative colanic acid biosynthesis acetyltransferase WcaF